MPLIAVFTLTNLSIDLTSRTQNVYAETLQGSNLPRHGSYQASPGSILDELALPEELGTIQETYRPEHPRQLVLYVQDAHAQADSIRGIRQIIQYVQKEFGLPLVLLEGGEGRLDSLFFKSFPAKEMLESTLKDYVQRGELSGGEIAAMTDETAATAYFGVEEQGLYDENRRVYIEALKKENPLLGRLEKKETGINQGLSNVSGPVRKFIQSHREFQKANLTLPHYLENLQSVTPEKEWRDRYPELEKLIRISRISRKRQTERMQAELRALITRFQKDILPRLSKTQRMEMGSWLQLHQIGQVEAGLLLRRLKDAAGTAGIEFAIPESLKPAWDSSMTLESIQGTKLFEELNLLENRLRETLPRDSREKESVESYFSLELLKRLIKLEITHAEWRTLQKELPGLPERHGLMQDDLRSHLEFYELAARRDETIYRNALRRMQDKEANVALLVTGGFHAAGITEKFKQDQTAFALITPRLKSLEGRDNYFRVMHDEASFMRHFKGSYWEALVRDFSEKVLSQLPPHAKPAVLKTWRDLIIQQALLEGRIDQAGEYTRYVDEILYAMNGKNHDPLHSRAQAAVDQFLTGLKDLWSKGSITPQALEHLLKQAHPVSVSHLGTPIVLIKDAPIRSEQHPSADALGQQEAFGTRRSELRSSTPDDSEWEDQIEGRFFEDLALEKPGVPVGKGDDVELSLVQEVPMSDAEMVVDDQHDEFLRKWSLYEQALKEEPGSVTEDMRRLLVREIKDLLLQIAQINAARRQNNREILFREEEVVKLNEINRLLRPSQPARETSDAPKPDRSEMRSAEVRQKLIDIAQPFVDFLQEADDFSQKNPDAYFIPGSPDLRVILEFAKQYKQRKDTAPIFLSGGRGRGTAPLAMRILDYYQDLDMLNDENVEFLNSVIQNREHQGKHKYETHLMKFVLLQEGISEDLIYMEETPSTNTLANYQMSRPILETHFASANIIAPTVAIVAAPSLLARVKPTAENVWPSDWTIIRYPSYKLKLSELKKDEELIEQVGYVVGYPQKYAKIFTKLTTGNELKGYRDQRGEVFADEDQQRIDAIKQVFEDYLDTFNSAPFKGLEFDEIMNRLVPARSEVRAKKFNAEKVHDEITLLAYAPDAGNHLEKVYELTKSLLENRAYNKFDSVRDAVMKLLVEARDYDKLEELIPLIYQPQPAREVTARRMQAVREAAVRLRDEALEGIEKDEYLTTTAQEHSKYFIQTQFQSILKRLDEWSQEEGVDGWELSLTDEDRQFASSLIPVIQLGFSDKVIPSDVVRDLKDRYQQEIRKRDRPDRNPIYRERVRSVNQWLIQLPFSEDPAVQRKTMRILSQSATMMIEDSGPLIIYLITQYLRYGYASREENMSSMFDLMDMVNAAEQPGIINLLRLLAALIFPSNSGQQLLGVHQPERAKTRIGDYGIGIFGVIRDQIHNYMGIHVLGLLERQLEYYRRYGKKGAERVLYSGTYEVDVYKNRPAIPLKERSRFPGKVIQELEEYYDQAGSMIMKGLEERLEKRARLEGKTFYALIRSLSDEELQSALDEIGAELGKQYDLLHASVTPLAYLWVYREFSGRFAEGNLFHMLKQFRGVNPVYLLDNEAENLESELREQRLLDALRQIILIKQKLRQQIFQKEPNYSRDAVRDQMMTDTGRDDTGNGIGGARIKDRKLKAYQADFYLSQIEQSLIDQVASERFSKITPENYDEALEFLEILSTLGYLNGDYTLDQTDHVETLSIVEDPGVIADLFYLMRREASQYDAFYERMVRPVVESVTAHAPAEDVRRYLKGNFSDGITDEEMRFQALTETLGQIRRMNRGNRQMKALLEKLQKFGKQRKRISKKASEPEAVKAPELAGILSYLKSKIFGGIEQPQQPSVPEEKKPEPRRDLHDRYVVLGPNSSAEELDRALALGRYRLGAKGIGLVRALKLGIPVPPFAIFSNEYSTVEIEKVLPEVLEKLDEAIKGQKNMGLGSHFAAGERPYFLSVRASQYLTLPGQTDTLTNIGMNINNVPLLAHRLTLYGISEEDARWTAWDSYRRMVEDYAVSVLNIEKDGFDEMIESFKTQLGKPQKEQMTAAEMEAVARLYYQHVAKRFERSIEIISEEPMDQLVNAIDAVVASYDRAQDYLTLRNIKGDWPGTSLIIQAMTYGNIRNGSGTGVVYTRDPVTWHYGMNGSFKWSAQGRDLADHASFPIAYESLDDAPWRDNIQQWGLKLEQLTGANVESEITIQASSDQTRPWLLQARDAHIPDDFPSFKEDLSKQIKKLLIGKGEALGAAGGAYRGFVIYPEQEVPEARFLKKIGADGVVLVADRLDPQDVPGLIDKGVKAVLTRRGGNTSHTSDIARDLGMVAVVGASDMQWDSSGYWLIKGISIPRGTLLSLDGRTGEVALGFHEIKMLASASHANSLVTSSADANAARSELRSSLLGPSTVRDASPTAPRSELRSSRLGPLTEAMPAWELMKVLDLESAEKVGPRKRGPPNFESYEIQRILIPERLNPDLPPQNGLEILHNELAPAREFELLYNPEGNLITIFPAPTSSFLSQLNESAYPARLLYFDLTAYYFDWPQVGELDHRKTEEIWNQYAAKIEQDQDAIYAYKRNAGYLERSPGNLSIDKVFRYFNQDQDPFVYAEIDQETGRVYVQQFDPGDYDAYEFNVLKPNTHQIIFSVFPTVYSPASPMHWDSDQKYYEAILKDLNLEPRQQVLTAFAGSGFDTWLAYLAMSRSATQGVKTGRLHAFDINPLAIANARALAKRAGFEVDARIHDNLIRSNGVPLFEAIMFDRILANMPMTHPVDERYRKQFARLPLVKYWDGDGGKVIQQFARGIPHALRQGGSALVWNNFDYKDYGNGQVVNPIRRMLQSAGTFNPDTNEAATPEALTVEVIHENSSPKGGYAVYTIRHPEATPVKLRSEIRNWTDILKDIEVFRENPETTLNGQMARTYLAEAVKNNPHKEAIFLAGRALLESEKDPQSESAQILSREVHSAYIYLKAFMIRNASRYADRFREIRYMENQSKEEKRKASDEFIKLVESEANIILRHYDTPQTFFNEVSDELLESGFPVVLRTLPDGTKSAVQLFYDSVSRELMVIDPVHGSDIVSNGVPKEKLGELEAFAGSRFDLIAVDDIRPDEIEAALLRRTEFAARSELRTKVDEDAIVAEIRKWHQTTDGEEKYNKIFELTKTLLMNRHYEAFDEVSEAVLTDLIRFDKMELLNELMDLVFFPAPSNRVMARRVLAVKQTAEEKRQALLEKDYLDEYEIRRINWHLGEVKSFLENWASKLDPAITAEDVTADDRDFANENASSIAWGLTGSDDAVPSEIYYRLKADILTQAQKYFLRDHHLNYHKRIRHFNAKLAQIHFSSDPKRQQAVFALFSKAATASIEDSPALLVYLITQFLRYGYTVPEENSGPAFDFMDMVNVAALPAVTHLLRMLGNLIFANQSGQVLVGPDDPVRVKTRQGDYGFGIYGVLRDEMHNYLGVHNLGLLERQLEYYRLLGEPDAEKVLYSPQYEVDAFKSRKAVPLFERSMFPEKIKEQLSGWQDERGSPFMKALYRRLAKKDVNFYETLRTMRDDELQRVIDDVNTELGTDYNLLKSSLNVVAYLWVYRHLSERYSAGGVYQMLRRFNRASTFFSWDEDSTRLTDALDQKDTRKALQAVIQLKKRILHLIYEKNERYDRNQIMQQYIKDYGRDDIGNAVGGAEIKDHKFKAYLANYYLSQIEGYLIDEIMSDQFQTVTPANQDEAVQFVAQLAEIGFLNGDYTIDQLDHTETLKMDIDPTIKRDLLNLMLLEVQQTDVYYNRIVKPVVEDITAKTPAADIHRFFKGKAHAGEMDLNQKKEELVIDAMDQMHRMNRGNRALKVMIEKMRKIKTPPSDGPRHRAADFIPYVVLGPNSTPEEIDRALAMGRFRLGAKGIGLVRALKLGIRVPPFLIFSRELSAEEMKELLPEAMVMLDVAIKGHKNYGLGSSYASDELPYFLSIRPSFYLTLPGLAFTATNVGMTPDNIAEFKNRLQNYGVSGPDAAWTAWDSYRRFLEDYGTGVLKLNQHDFDKILDDYKQEIGVKRKENLQAGQMEELSRRYFNFIQNFDMGSGTVMQMLQNPEEQLERTLEAVATFEKNILTYIKQRNIKGNWPNPGVIIQAMAYGNIRNESDFMGGAGRQESGTGIVYTRDPNEWFYKMSGDFKWAAQGKDLAGQSMEPLRYSALPYQSWQDEVKSWGDRFEQLTGANIEIEMTLQRTQGVQVPWLLQARSAHVPDAAPVFAAKPRKKNIILQEGEAQGVSGGAYAGLVYFNQKDIPPARELEQLLKRYLKRNFHYKNKNELMKWYGPILMIDRLEAVDVPKLKEKGVRGVVTRRGGYVSHTADIARALGITVVVGADELTPGPDVWQRGDVVIRSGDPLSIDARSGVVAKGLLPIIRARSELRGLFSKNPSGREIKSLEMLLHQVLLDLAETAALINETAEKIAANDSVVVDAIQKAVQRGIEQNFAGLRKNYERFYVGLVNYFRREGKKGEEDKEEKNGLAKLINELVALNPDWKELTPQDEWNAYDRDLKPDLSAALLEADAMLKRRREIESELDRFAKGLGVTAQITEEEMRRLYDSNYYEYGHLRNYYLGLFYESVQNDMKAYFQYQKSLQSDEGNYYFNESLTRMIEIKNRKTAQEWKKLLTEVLIEGVPSRDEEAPIRVGGVPGTAHFLNRYLNDQFKDDYLDRLIELSKDPKTNKVDPWIRAHFENFKEVRRIVRERGFDASGWTQLRRAVFHHLLYQGTLASDHLKKTDPLAYIMESAIGMTMSKFAREANPEYFVKALSRQFTHGQLELAGRAYQSSHQVRDKSGDVHEAVSNIGAFVESLETADAAQTAFIFFSSAKDHASKISILEAALSASARSELRSDERDAKPSLIYRSVVTASLASAFAALGASLTISTAAVTMRDAQMFQISLVTLTVSDVLFTVFLSTYFSQFKTFHERIRGLFALIRKGELFGTGETVSEQEAPSPAEPELPLRSEVRTPFNPAQAEALGRTVADRVLNDLKVTSVAVPDTAVFELVKTLHPFAVREAHAAEILATARTAARTRLEEALAARSELRMPPLNSAGSPESHERTQRAEVLVESLKAVSKPLLIEYRLSQEEVTEAATDRENMMERLLKSASDLVSVNKNIAVRITVPEDVAPVIKKFRGGFKDPYRGVIERNRLTLFNRGAKVGEALTRDPAITVTRFVGEVAAGKGEVFDGSQFAEGERAIHLNRVVEAAEMPARLLVSAALALTALNQAESLVTAIPDETHGRIFRARNEEALRGLYTTLVMLAVQARSEARIAQSA